MKYLVFLLGVLLMSCSTEVKHEDNTQAVITTSTIQPENSVVTEAVPEVLKGFPRFFFVKDSLGFTLENVKVLADTYSSEKINFNQLEKDTAYFIMLDFLKEIKMASEDDKALYEFDEVKESEIAKYYKQYGISIEMIEGGYYCFPDYSYLAKLFEGDLNPDLDIYKDFLIVSNRHIFDDGGLTISWMDLASQIIETEDFYNNLSNTVYKDEVLINYIWLINPLLYGSENSFIVDDYNDSMKGLLPEVKSAYDMLMINTIHNSGNLFTTHLENLNKSGFNPKGEEIHYMTDEEIEAFLND